MMCWRASSGDGRAVRLHPKPVPVHAAGVHAVSGRRVCEPGSGDGYQRIAAALREAGIEPATTRNDINTFTMTITKQRTMANSSPGDVVKAIMTVLERHSAMSVKEIMRELQLTPLAATSGMRELMKEGRVARVKFADDRYSGIG